MVDLNELADNTFFIYNVKHCDTRILASYWLDRTFGSRQQRLCGHPRADLARGDLLDAAQLWTLRRPVNSDPDTFVIENFEFSSCILALSSLSCLGGGKSVVLKQKRVLETKQRSLWKFVPQSDGSFKILNKQFDSHALFTDGRRILTSIDSMEEVRSESSSLWKLIPLFSASARIDILWDVDNRQSTTPVKGTWTCPYGLTPMWRGSQEEKKCVMLLPGVKEALRNALDRDDAMFYVWQLKAQVQSAIERSQSVLFTSRSVNVNEEDASRLQEALWNAYDRLTSYSVDGKKKKNIVKLKEALKKAIERLEMYKMLPQLRHLDVIEMGFRDALKHVEIEGELLMSTAEEGVHFCKCAIEKLCRQIVIRKEEKDAIMLMKEVMWNAYDSLMPFSACFEEGNIVVLNKALLEAIESPMASWAIPIDSVKETLQIALKFVEGRELLERERELLKRELEQAWAAKRLPPTPRNFAVPNKQHCQVLQTSLVFESPLWELVLYSSDIKRVEVSSEGLSLPVKVGDQVDKLVKPRAAKEQEEEEEEEERRTLLKYI